MNGYNSTLLVFDIDGTLTDTVSIHQKAFLDSLIELGIQEINTNFNEYIHHTDSYIAKVIFENYFKSEFSEDSKSIFEDNIYNRIVGQKVIEIHGTKSLLGKLDYNEGIDICFATGSFGKPAKYKLDCLNITYNDNILTNSNYLLTREDIVSSAIQKAKKFFNQNNYNRIISVGDGLWDLKTAKNLNLEFIGVGKKNKDILIENGCNKYFDNLKDFDLNEL